MAIENINSKRNKRNPLIVAGLAASAALLLTGCTDPDYQGANDGYEVRGVVSSVDTDHTFNSDNTLKIQEDQLVVVSENGRAKNWFENHKGQDWFSDKFDLFDGYVDPDSKHWYDLCGSQVTVGKVIGSNGAPM